MLRQYRLLLLLSGLVLVAGCSNTPQKPEPVKQAPAKPKVPITAESEAKKRLAAWKELVARNQDIADDRKLALANDFINHLVFVDDIDHWGQEDYWATPTETVASGGGDCEDFAIAKYFTLKYLQIPESRMHITYVKALRINKPHMVLTYYPTPESEPLVLDNLDPIIKPSSQRQDLFPIYSFNAEGLWVSKNRTDEYAGDSSRISLWQKLLEKMQHEQDISAK